MLCVYSSPLIRIPILKYVDLDNFMLLLANHHFAVYSDILYGLGKRYEYESAFEDLHTEHTFIQNFKSKLNEELERYSPDQYLGKALIKKWIGELSRLENKFENYSRKQIVSAEEAQ